MRVRVGWLAVTALILAACSAAPPAAPPPASQAREQDAAHEQDAALEQDTPDVDDPAELRTSLEMLLGHHATLAARSLRSRIAGDEAVFESAVSALSRNTEDLSAVVGEVAGADAAETFRDLWGDHTRAFLAYATGIREHDEDPQEEARAALERYREEFGAFTEGATAGELPAGAVADALGHHIDLLLGVADAFAQGDHATAYALQREAYRHMFPIGTDLAEGFAQALPDEFPVVPDDPPAQLRSALGLLLGEHVELAVDAMRAGITGAPDFEAAAGALEESTGDLAAAIAALAGGEASGRFRELWADHVDLLVAYTVAVADDDDAARDAAELGLGSFERAFGDFLEQMTAEAIDAGAVTAAMRVHNEQLRDQIEAYATGDYPKAHEIAFATYRHVFGTAAALGAAIQDRMGVEMPIGGAATGAGGVADPDDPGAALDEIDAGAAPFEITSVDTSDHPTVGLTVVAREPLPDAPDFTVTQDGVPRPVSLAATAEGPLEVAFVVDTSAGMADQLRGVATAFTDLALRLPADTEMAVVTAGGVARLGTPGTGDAAAAVAALADMEPRGEPALAEAVAVAVEQFADDSDGGVADGRDAVIIAAGEGGGSPEPTDDVAGDLRRSGASLFTVSLGDPMVEMLAASAGGSVQRVRDMTVASTALRRIVEDLDRLYRIDFTAYGGDVPTEIGVGIGESPQDRATVTVTIPEPTVSRPGSQAAAASDPDDDGPEAAAPARRRPWTLLTILLGVAVAVPLSVWRLHRRRPPRPTA